MSSAQNIQPNLIDTAKNEDADSASVEEDGKHNGLEPADDAPSQKATAPESEVHATTTATTDVS